MQERKSLAGIQEEFTASFSLYVGLERNLIQDSAKLLFDILVNSCESFINHSIHSGSLYAHDVKSSTRYALLADELAVVSKNIELLTKQGKRNINAIYEYKGRYREQIADRHSYIVPPDFDQRKEIPINLLYVEPDFTVLSNEIDTPIENRFYNERSYLRFSEENENNTDRMSLIRFLSVIHRAVILGTPGAGKSTLALKICSELARSASNLLISGRELTPILVILREYGIEKKNRKCSILQFIESNATSIYQLPPPPEGTFEYLLLNGHALVIFDGLDELLDTAYRQQISDDVESFCNIYSSTPIIVTSRVVGYEQAPLNPRKFKTYEIASFKDKQVEEYTTKWFDIGTDLAPNQKKDKIRSFLKESDIVPEFRSNPLMLALMCNIYRGENYIPRNRPEVYDKCANLLFDRWDRSRGIGLPKEIEPIEAHIRAAMTYLAQWVYGNENLQGGVTESRLVAKSADYLHPRRFEDRDEAEKAAQDFIQFCKGRAWVFTDTGTTPEGERLYQFTHRTFLEFFTAVYLVRTQITPEVLITFLKPKIMRREWDVVAQLAFQIQNKNIEGAADNLLTALLDPPLESEDNDDQYINILSFAVRCLEFLVPSPRVIRLITKTCIEWLIAMSSGSVELFVSRVNQVHLHKNIEIMEIYKGLFMSSTEKRRSILSGFENTIIEKINNGTVTESVLALELGLNTSVSLQTDVGERTDILEIRQMYASCSKQFVAFCSRRIAELAPKEASLCYDLFFHGEMDINDLIRLHGVESLFAGRRYFMFPQKSSASIARNIIIYPDHNLEDLGRVLYVKPTPWIRRIKVNNSDVFTIGTFESHKQLEEEMSSDARFGLFVLFAIMFEVSPRYSLDIIKRNESIAKIIGKIFLIDYDKVDIRMLKEEIAKMGFTNSQQSFICKWIRREFYVVY